MSIALEASSASTDSHFEIVDFTAASPWERFIAQLEAAIRKWMSGDAATSGDGATTGPGDGTSRSNNVEVTLDRHVFRLEWHRLDGRHKCVGYSIDATTRSTTSSVDNCDAQTSTFLTNELETGSSPLLDTHELHRLAGYRDFLLLVPVHVAPSIVAATTGGGSSSRTPSTSRSRTRTRTSSPSARTPLLGLTSALARITDAGVTAVSHAAATVSAAATAAAASVAASTLPAATVDLALGKLVMSSAAIALGNTECKMPVFVQMGPLWRRLYAGVQCLRDVETRYTESCAIGYHSVRF